MTLSVCPACLPVHGKSSSSDELITYDNPSECARESSSEAFHTARSNYSASSDPRWVVVSLLFGTDDEHLGSILSVCH